jgi:heptosyltransferase-3
MRMNVSESVLVVVTQRIGDVLLATPLIRTLKRAWPQAQIDALVFESTKGILAANPDLHEVITIPERPTFGEHARLYQRIWRAYDFAISTMAGDRPTLYAWAAGRRSVGVLLPDRKSRWKRRLLSRWVEFDNLNTHTVLMNLKLAELLNIPKHYEVVVSWGAAAAAHVDALLLRVAPRQRLAVLHLYPKFNYKMWHAQGWSKLAHWLAQQGLRIVLSGGDVPKELEYVGKILPLLPQDTLNLAGQLNLEQSVYLLSRAAIYIGPDTTLTHAAAALGVPTVALYGPSNPVKWGPWPKNHREERNPWKRLGSQRAGNVMLIQGQGACVPCLLEGCERNIASFSDCLQQLPAAKVIAAAAALLNTEPESAPRTKLG